MGGAVGLAVLATLAAGTTRHDHTTARSAQAALTTGYDQAFLTAGLLLLVGAGLATLIRPTPQTAPATSTSSDTVAGPATHRTNPSPAPAALVMTNNRPR